MTEIQKDILRTLAFSDVFEFPLTAEEIQQDWRQRRGTREQWGGKVEEGGQGGEGCGDRGDSRFHNQPFSFLAIINELERMVHDEILEREEVFYCLKGRRAIVAERKMRYSKSLRKRLKSQKWIRLLHALPFVRNVYLAGSVARGSARRDSDIDVVIVSRRGRVWSSRFFVNSALALLSLRVHGRHGFWKNLWVYVLRLFGFEKSTVDEARGLNTLCTAFFLDESVDPTRVFPEDRQFQFWVHCWLPTRDKNYKSPIKSFLEACFYSLPERVFRWGQEKVLMPRNLRERAGEGGNDVVLGDRMIKLHWVDRRREHESQYHERLRNLALIDE